MSKFTYESTNTTEKLEIYEWDNVWWEHTENTTAKRILYVGDSISCATRHHITALSNMETLCDGFGTSKALDNPYFKPTLELFMKQQNKCDAILFNNGLHGWHLPEEEYEPLYDDMLSFLTKTGKPVFVVLTTDDNSEPNINQRVEARNKIAIALAKKYQLPIIDLYTIAINNSHLHLPDKIHFNDTGYELFAKCILESIS